MCVCVCVLVNQTGAGATNILSTLRDMRNVCNYHFLHKYKQNISNLNQPSHFHWLILSRNYSTNLPQLYYYLGTKFQYTFRKIVVEN